MKIDGYDVVLFLISFAVVLVTGWLYSIQVGVL